ncbi:glycosyl hydrolase family 28-related protein, partial [Mycolicibacterium litorale]|uniref:glycosyl hydrolase family 28-related protein n=1 Tax=Mycolicibacterium litorale TaxID=758802 RepID=UPI00399F2132
AAAALAACALDGRPTVVDVRAFGARGDGIADDSQAIQAAAAALRPEGILRFPRGVYRFAQRWPPGGAAIVLSGTTDVTVEFDPGAELYMDNLHPTERTGSSHGVLVRGPVSRVTLRDINIRWADGARRSLGDGIRVEGMPTAGEDPPSGWPGQDTPVDGVVVSGCTVRSSPQTGVVMLGVSDIEVTGLRVTDSGADGLHFNACRNAVVDGFSAVNTGDDGLALVTYFTPQPAFDEPSHTFSFPDLTEWSNTDFRVSNVNVFGCRANGVRLAGAAGVDIRGLDVVAVHSGSAFLVDSAEPGTDVGWNYVATRGVRLGDLTATDCDMGIHLLARPGASGDARFTDFDVHVDDAKIDDCATWAVRAESLTDRHTTGLRIDTCSVTASSTTGGNGGLGIATSRAISFGDMSIRHSEPVVVVDAVDAEELTVDHLSVAITRPDPPDSAAKYVVSLEDSSGDIEELTIGWPAAPRSWIPVRRSAALALPNLTVSPPVATSSVQRP